MKRRSPITCADCELSRAKISDRRLGITAARAAARLKIARIGIARGDGKAAAKRRKKGQDARRTEEEERYYAWGPKAHVGGQRNGC